MKRPEDDFDWKRPNYTPIFRERARRLARLREHPDMLPGLRAYYRDHIEDFISDWGMTYDPRNVAQSRIALMPFLLQPEQRKLVRWFHRLWRESRTGILEKSRDIGASWIAMSWACSLCILYDNISIGFGSATEPKLDRSGDPDSLFWKGRMFVKYLPVEFRGGCDIDVHAPDKRILFPETNGSITGEVGDKIGHGGRKSAYLIDEAALLEHPQLVESGISGVTDCRIDMSSVSLDGMANDFSIRRHSGNFDVFTLHYRDDLRKDEAWKVRKQASLDPIVWAANYEIDYTGSAQGVIIPHAWAAAAVDAHLKLKRPITGIRRGALDVADEGRDLNCFGSRHGNLVTSCTAWSGKGSDIFASTERAIMLCDELGLDGFDYDADGLGAGVRGDAKRILERREQETHRKPLRIADFRGSAAVFDPESFVPGTDVMAKDRFQNLKAQSYFSVRERFRNTFRGVNGEEYDPENWISISSECEDLQKIISEIAQPQWKLSGTGRVVVDKVPEGAMSPNRADMIVILFAPRFAPLYIPDRLLNEEPDDEDLP